MGESVGFEYGEGLKVAVSQCCSLCIKLQFSYGFVDF